MKNAMQLKAIIKNLAKEKHISAQLVMQNFMLERLLERISVSKYQQNFILKGGFLIAAMVGLDTRARDYYDIYILAKLQYANIEPAALKAALNATTKKRGSSAVVKEYRGIMDTVKSEVMRQQWENYQKDFEYAADIVFEDACDVVVELLDELIGV